MKSTLAFLALASLFTSPHPLASAGSVKLIRTPGDGIQPQAAVDNRGVVHLIYLKGDPNAADVFYVRRNLDEADFSKPLKVNSHPGSAIAIGTIRGAQLAVGKNGRIHVAWNGRAPDKGSYLDAPMLYTRLNEAGSAFEPERNVIQSAKGLDGGGSVAADNDGNVFVMWHATIPGNANGEAGRAVFVARSMDDGKTFAPERPATSRPTGACGCCGMKAFADSHGNLFALYRGATDLVNRHEILLMSRDHGGVFETVYEHGWKISTCPMSSAFITESKAGILAAAETHGRVFFVKVDPASGKVSSPTSPDSPGKYPVAVANGRGQILLVWTEGTGWGKDGKVAWQVYGADGQPTSEVGRADGLPPWSMATAVGEPGGDFAIIY